MVTPWRKDKQTGKEIPGEIKRTVLPLSDIPEGEVLVEVAGCGVCHTDVGYLYDGVPTVNKPPLTLGHEISGTVVAGDAEWIGKEVIVVAAMPCRKCYLCKTGRANRCMNQKMPGNSMGIYGGFSSHIPVPSIDLCEVRGRGEIPLSHLSVIADAVATPFHAAKRAQLGLGDNVIVIGVGGVGQYMVQEAKALGARTVIAIDIVTEKLDNMRNYGADFTVDATGKSARDISDIITAFRKKQGLPVFGWKIFECTGSKPGQETALTLLSFTGKLIIIGFGQGKVEYAFSRLMAFDAEVIGTWGCLPEYYPIVLDMVLSGKINIEAFVEIRPMSSIVETFDEVHRSGSPTKRIVLEPDF